MKTHVIVVGGGAAGMMAAISAVEAGALVTLLEKNEKLGKKLYITGKGRCNVTNGSDPDSHFASVKSNSRFLYSAYHAFDNRAMMEFLERQGVPLKTERGNRVFPRSDHASDVIAGLERALSDRAVQVVRNCRVTGLCLASDSDGASDRGVKKQVTGVMIKEADGKKKLLTADRVILSCGGLSYQTTGSTGDGLLFARDAGHSIVPCIPALVPLEVSEPDAAYLQGLSLKNVTVSLYDGKKLLFQEMGEMLFTHFGVSGPLILSASSCAGRRLLKGPLRLEIDLKPALTEEQLHRRILRDFSQAENKQLKNVISSLYPARLAPVVIARSGVAADRPVHEITKEERTRIVETTKKLVFTVTGTRGFSEAVITQGGVSVREVDPSTMASKLVKNLYFAGEMLDLDALTGGYNLQIAWSTGYLAGLSAAKNGKTPKGEQS